MIDGDTALSAIYAVINMLISVLSGYMLSKLDVLTTKTRKVLSDVNYYLLCPVYCVYFIMQAIDRNRLSDVGIILWSVIPSVIISFTLMSIIAIAFKFDIRMKYSYSFVHVYANVIIMPQMLTDSLCEKGGKYEDTPSCVNKLVKPYSSVPLIYMNIMYWVTVLPLLQNEKRTSLITKKIMLVALNFYKTIDEFLADSKDCTAANLIGSHQIKEQSSEDKAQPHMSPTSILQTDAALFQANSHRLLTTSSERFITEYFGKNLTSERYKELTDAYAVFEEKFFKKPENDAVRKQIEKELLEPEQLMTLPPEKSLKDPRFYVNHILCSPPAICSIIGLILGFIFPLKEWVFDPENVPLPTFLSTFAIIGGMMSPVSMFLLGTYLAQTAVITRDMYLTWKHIIISNLVKNLFMPAVGLFWVGVVIKATSGSSYEDNPILIFMSYTYWMVPNGIVLIAVYAVVDYFAKEFAVLSVYMNLIAIPMMIIFMILHFIIYEN